MFSFHKCQPHVSRGKVTTKSITIHHLGTIVSADKFVVFRYLDSVICFEFFCLYIVRE